MSLKMIDYSEVFEAAGERKSKSSGDYRYGDGQQVTVGPL
jgi:hypothetical protein